MLIIGLVLDGHKLTAHFSALGLGGVPANILNKQLQRRSGGGCGRGFRCGFGGRRDLDSGLWRRLGRYAFGKRDDRILSAVKELRCAIGVFADDGGDAENDCDYKQSAVTHLAGMTHILGDLDIFVPFSALGRLLGSLLLRLFRLGSGLRLRLLGRLLGLFLLDHRLGGLYDRGRQPVYFRHGFLAAVGTQGV